MDSRSGSDAAHKEDTMPGVGSRRSSRQAFRARVQCWVQYSDSSTFWQSAFWGATSDICEQGIFVSADLTPAIDSLVILRVVTDYGTLKVMARVVHNIENVGFGCQFIHLNEQQRVALMFLKTMKGSTRAPRGVRVEQELAA